ncbi:hypothetical protein TrRE_jg5663 [Triparma retinervis]|uniref:Uncharacterized protein n=1 Tax=Triparma retinervis TaxID=2557542 RepID=A0A9W7AV18_9STRA|nr:hypothetical protein TrRE_jg5663 [Triparma retinervis]
MLWELHARGNMMTTSVSLGGGRRAMGVLDLGKNKLTEEELGRVLGGMTVISLSVSHNSTIEGSSARIPAHPLRWLTGGGFWRRLTTHGCWTVTLYQRRRGWVWLRPPVQEMLASLAAEPLPGSPCSMFLSQVLARAPTKNQDSVDIFQDKLEGLEFGMKLDLTVLLSVALQYNIPRTVLVGCLEVLCDGELRR